MIFAFRYFRYKQPRHLGFHSGKQTVPSVVWNAVDCRSQVDFKGVVILAVGELDERLVDLAVGLAQGVGGQNRLAMGVNFGPPERAMRLSRTSGEGTNDGFLMAFSSRCQILSGWSCRQNHEPKR
jgi:hypothetical protein